MSNRVPYSLQLIKQTVNFNNKKLTLHFYFLTFYRKETYFTSITGYAKKKN